MGDYIGMESCFDLNHNHDVHQTSPSSPHLHKDTGGSSYRGMRDRRPRGKTEFPPPIPLLARTENLTSHMPWVLRRHYTTDGRLILTEERVKHHEYFRAHRSNGRLTLQLVPLEQNQDDDDFPFDPDEEENEDEAEEDAERESIEDPIAWNMEEEGENSMGAEVEELEKKMKKMGGCDNNSGAGEGSIEKGGNNNLNGSAGKCLSYNNGYVLGMAVPAIRPVQI